MKESYMMKWQERLKYERQSRGWTQSMLAEKIGIHKHTIARWENGHAFPHPYYREKLTTLFGTNFDEREIFQAIGESMLPEKLPERTLENASCAEIEQESLVSSTIAETLSSSLVQERQTQDQDAYAST